MRESEQTPTDTLYLGGLDQRVTRRILYDLCQQVRAMPLSRILPLLPCSEGHSGHWKVLNCTEVEESRYEFVQAGPVVRIHLPEEEVGGIHRGYAFCQYSSVVSTWLLFLPAASHVCSSSP